VGFYFTLAFAAGIGQVRGKIIRVMNARHALADIPRAGVDIVLQAHGALLGGLTNAGGYSAFTAATLAAGGKCLLIGGLGRRAGPDHRHRFACRLSELQRLALPARPGFVSLHKCSVKLLNRRHYFTPYFYKVPP
jgi:hypothetical protein